MILGAILRGIKAVVDFVAKVIAWLLIAFGLWVPLLYSIIFLIVVVIMGVPLATTGTVYFFGLFISIILAMWFCVAMSKRKSKQRKRKKNAGYNVAEVQKKQGEEAPAEDPPTIKNDHSDVVAQNTVAEFDNPQPAPVQQQPAPQQPVPQPAQQPQQWYAPPQQPAPQPQPAPAQQQWQWTNNQPQRPYEQNPDPWNYGQAPQDSWQGEPQRQRGRQWNSEPDPWQTDAPRREQPTWQEPRNEQPWQTDAPRREQPTWQEPRNEQPWQTDAPRREQPNWQEPRNEQPWQTDAPRREQPTWQEPRNEQPPQNTRADETYQRERPRPDETPRIFRMRSEPDMLVYEYSDRLEYYRETAFGRQFVRTQLK